MADVLVLDLEDALGDGQARLVGVDVDEGPPQASELARAQAAHEPGQPHRWARVLGDALGDQLLGLLEGEALARLRRPARWQQHVRSRVGLDAPGPLRVLARLVEVVPGPVDCARGVLVRRHVLEQLLEPLSCRAIDPLVTDHRPHARAEELAGVGDRVRRLGPSVARGPRRRHVRAPSLEPVVDHLVERELPGAPRIGRLLLGPQGEQLVEVGLGVGLLDPLDLATGAVREADPGHPPLLRLVPADAGLPGHRNTPDVANLSKGYVQSGYVGKTLIGQRPILGL